MSKNVSLGKLGEEIACRFLIKKKYKIIKRNYRRLWGELDIIAQSPDKVLVFVEVKTLEPPKNNGEGIMPEEHLTRTKFAKLQKMALYFANSHPSLLSDKGWRIDLIAVDVKKGSDAVGIRHYENIHF